MRVEAWHRRQALNLVSQLPEKVEDARLVLQAMQELVDGFLGEGPPQSRPQRVLSLKPVLPETDLAPPVPRSG